MWLFIGLGNPGQKYQNHRHNIGFMVADHLVGDFSFLPWRKKFEGQWTEGHIGGEKVGILKPDTYMNNSGQAIQKAAKFYKISTDRIVVFYDDLDLDPGKVKVKQGGGAAGHNGIRSMMQHLPDDLFWRVRLGIGHPGDKSRVTGYVLGDFAKADEGWLSELKAALSRYAPELTAARMNDYAAKVAQDMKGL